MKDAMHADQRNVATPASSLHGAPVTPKVEAHVYYLILAKGPRTLDLYFLSSFLQFALGVLRLAVAASISSLLLNF
eukprot:3513206-Pyramimonas_sp.AAC.1